MVDQEIYDKIDLLCNHFHDQQIEMFHWLHQHPELAYQEFKSGAYIYQHLKKLPGIEVTYPIARTGVKAVLNSDHDGPTVALRADFDALPVKEETGLSYASNSKTVYEGQETYVAHVCGHDANAAAALGTATVLSQLREYIPGKVVFLFQPAEEGAPEGCEGGAELMVKEKSLENPKVQAIFGFHSNSSCYPGQVMLRKGVTHASMDTFIIKIWGEQAHGSQPWSGKDPIVAGASLVNSLQTIISRDVDLQKGAAVITVGYFWGGIKVNIIPEGMEMGLTVRSLSNENRELIISRIKEMADFKAQSYGCQAEVIHTHHYPRNINHEQLYNNLQGTVKRVLGKEKIIEYPATTKSEDFSYFSREIPGLFMYYGSAPHDKPLSEAKPNHHPEYQVDEGALNFVTRLECNILVDCLELLGRINL